MSSVVILRKEDAACVRIMPPVPILILRIYTRITNTYLHHTIRETRVPVDDIRSVMMMGCFVFLHVEVSYHAIP
ncbi:hypothetical protein CEXT_784651 [Caerostris extrusa]|uniref:Uncharacterized protein n=1 Tax=Caerostris extrusa TaxID=172846 RepID=A0AAV4R2L2_CAEEX|nr:hypothetical protein CEXT_784651 [Caerostris extrusa]